MAPRTTLEPQRLRGLRAPWALANVEVWTGGCGDAQALAFAADGTVAACGTRRAATDALAGQGPVIDGGGAFVCPGFIDAHVHVRASASAALAIDVSHAGSEAELLGIVRGATRVSPRRGERRDGRRDWVTLVGSGLHSSRGAAPPDRRALDRVSRGVPVRVRDRSGHGWLFNSAGLRALGIELCRTGRGELIPSGVSVERGRDGVATGFVADDVGWVGSRLGLLSSPEQLAGAVRTWSTDIARHGIVAICDATATNDHAQVQRLFEWRRRGLLRQELTFLASPGAAIDRLPRAHLAGVKFADANDPRLARVLEAGLSAAVHCVDTSQTGTALRIAEAVPAKKRGRLRLEHASHIPPDWLAIVKRLDGTVVTHPTFIEERGDEYLADPSLAPCEWLYRLASWTRAGVPLAFASDAPFGPVDPIRALRSAAARRTAGGEVIGPDEALTGEPALRALTTVAAACSGLDRLGFGRLRNGGPAAAVILSDDPRAGERVDELAVIATVIGGDVVD